MLPSDVVAAIDRIFPAARAEAQDGPGFVVDRPNAAKAAAVLDLVEQVPEELITLTGEDYSTFIVAISAVRSTLATWASHREAGHYLAQNPPFLTRNPITLIREALSRCPDTAPAPATAGLAFVTDALLRESLRQDISGAERAFASDEWKAATVLAGSVVEALLLWHVQQVPPAAVTAAGHAAVAGGHLTSTPSGAPETWGLAALIEVAGGLGKLKPRTVTQCRQAKDFRNLIHPGRTQRLGATCTRATARAALAAVDFVVEDLS